MRSRWKITFIICVVIIAAVLAGCGAAEQRPALEKIEYTNLNDSGSRELLKELLSDAGVPKVCFFFPTGFQIFHQRDDDVTDE